jgi:hypothetical protein
MTKAKWNLQDGILAYFHTLSKKTVFTGLFSIGLLFVTPAVGDDAVSFTNEELQATLVLLRPDRSIIEVDGRTARFIPAPSLRYFGVPVAKKDLDLSLIAKIIDLRFERLQAAVPQVFFQRDALQIVIPLRDNPKALRCLLGSVGFSGVAAVATFAWEQGNDGRSRLVLKNSEIRGKITGKGVLASNLILKKVREFALKNFRDATENFLDDDAIQGTLEKGLLAYAEFELGVPVRAITPDSLKFFSEGNSSGIRYRVDL